MLKSVNINFYFGKICKKWENQDGNQKLNVSMLGNIMNSGRPLSRPNGKFIFLHIL